MLVRATQTFHHARGTVAEGEIFDSAHPVPVKFRTLFEPMDIEEASAVAPVVESATAAPGEKRSTVARNRAKKAVAPDGD